MKVNLINNYSYLGKNEAKRFRHESKNLINKLSRTKSQYDYIGRNPDGSSLQTKLFDILFNQVKNVGKDYATDEDTELLNVLKGYYVYFEEKEDYCQSSLLGGDKYIDRSKDVEDIDF